MPDAILALNAGSSSIKFALFDVAPAGTLGKLLAGTIEGIGTSPHFSAKDARGHMLVDRRETSGEATQEALLKALLSWIDDHLGEEKLVAVGHRIVHGGRDFVEPVALTPEVVDALEALTPLAPLHQPGCLAPVRAIAAVRPGLPQVGCFDTAFHHDLAPTAARYALPRRFESDGVRRYGFHGLSYSFIAGKLREIAPDLAGGRVIVAHLGNGASLCAMRDGRSVDTTMGMTALDGLVMGTRCGTLDPGVILYLQQAQGLSAKEIERLLYHESGLLGVSGISSDMRDLLASAEPGAREAVDLFVFRFLREAGGLIATLGGLDGLVFTAGIGEHAAEVRARICDRMGWLGAVLDPQANQSDADVISTAASRIELRVVPTDEEIMIARSAATIVGR